MYTFHMENNGHKSINTLEYFKDAYKITGVVESVSAACNNEVDDTIYKGIRTWKLSLCQ